MRRPDRTRPWYVRVLDSTGKDRHRITSQQPETKSAAPCPKTANELVVNGTLCYVIFFSPSIPEFTLHEKGLQGHISIGPLVSSRRPADVPRTYRSSSNRRALFVFLSSIGLRRISFVRASEESFRIVVCGALEVLEGQGTVLSWANRPVGVPSWPTSLRRATPPCAAPPRPAYGKSGFWTRQVCMGFRLFVLPKNRSGQSSTIPWRATGSVVPWANRPVGVPSCPAPPCPAPPCPAPPRPAAPLCAAPPRPARRMSEFWIQQVLLNTTFPNRTFPTRGSTKIFGYIFWLENIM